MIRTLIIDDDAPITYDLQLLIEKNPHFFVLGSCGSIEEAKILINTTNPDLLFLDVELKGGTAFNLLSQFPDPSFRIIFITAFNHYAIKAIKYGAFDYLLKPIDEEELTNSLNKLSNQPPLQDVQRKVALEYLQSTQKRIILRSQDYIQVVNFEHILYCEGDGSYTHFYLTDRPKITVSHSIKEYENLLPDSWFIRTHNSFLVNHHYVEGLHKDGYLILSGGIEIPVSVRRKELVKKFLLGDKRTQP